MNKCNRCKELESWVQEMKEVLVSIASMELDTPVPSQEERAQEREDKRRCEEWNKNRKDWQPEADYTRLAEVYDRMRIQEGMTAFRKVRRMAREFLAKTKEAGI